MPRTALIGVRRAGPSVWELVAGVIALAWFAALCDLVVHGACTDPGPPVAVPVPGTERAGYCAAILSPSEWTVTIGGPVLGALMAAAILRRRRPRAWWIAVVLIAAGALANACIAQSLPFAPTI